MKTIKSFAPRKAVYSIMLAGMLLLISYASNLPLVHAQAATPEPTIISDALVSLSTDKVSFGMTEDVILHVAITNPNDDAIRVLKWFIPAKDAEESLFVVTRDGEPITYLGAIYKRPSPTEQDYITLMAGESLTRDVNLSDYYDLSVSGNYQVIYDVASAELYAEQQDTDLLKMSGHLTSNQLELFIEGRALESKVIVPEIVTDSTGFSSCNASQQSTLLSARSSASTYAADALAYLTAGFTGLRYTTWFGVYDPGRYNTARSHFTNISSAMDTAPVNFNCGCTDPYYAYVYPSQPYNIYLCQAYWSAPLTGTDSKAGTLIHEMSHFNVVAGTDDYVYGQTGAKNLAISNPNNAVNNADNHEYFAENDPPIYEIDIYESDETSGQAKWIYSGVPQSHNILPATDVDWVKFQLGSQSGVLLETTGSTSSDTEIWLYNSSLVEVEFNDDEGLGNYSFIDRPCGVNPLPAGTYYVKVDDWGNNDVIPAYNLSFTSSPCPSTSIDVHISGERQGSYFVPPNPTLTKNYAGMLNGPVKVISSSGTPIFTSQRAFYGNSFNELMGYPANQFTTEYWFPWYDNVFMQTWILVGNPSTTDTANVEIYIGGGLQLSTSIPPNGRVTPMFGGVLNGPVRVVCTNCASYGGTIFASERSLYGDSFSEVMGYPDDQLTTEYWFPWYDNVYMQTWILVGNPSSTQTAYVDIYIGGAWQMSSPIPPNGRVTPMFGGVLNGPVQVVSTTGAGTPTALPIFASERSLYGTSFNEVMGYPRNQFTTDYSFPWYDNTGMQSWILVGNPSATQTAYVEIYIGGALQMSTSIPPNGRITPQFSTNTGPVRVLSTTGAGTPVPIDIFASERSLYGASFNEMMAFPADQLTTEYWFTWYDNVFMQTWILVSRP